MTRIEAFKLTTAPGTPGYRFIREPRIVPARERGVFKKTKRHAR